MSMGGARPVPGPPPNTTGWFEALEAMNRVMKNEMGASRNAMMQNTAP